MENLPINVDTINKTIDVYASVLDKFEGQEDNKLNNYLENIGIKI